MDLLLELLLDLLLELLLVLLLLLLLHVFNHVRVASRPPYDYVASTYCSSSSSSLAAAPGADPWIHGSISFIINDEIAEQGLAKAFELARPGWLAFGVVFEPSRTVLNCFRIVFFSFFGHGCSAAELPPFYAMANVPSY